MGPKRPAPSQGSDSEKKRKKTILTIDEKVKLLDLIKSGMSFAAVARKYGINESTVRYINKDAVNIRKTAEIAVNRNVKRVISEKLRPIGKMEASLALWIQDARKKNIPLDTNTICTKARSLYEAIIQEKGDGDGDNEDADDPDDPQPSSSSGVRGTPTKQKPFMASHGWFDRFRKRFQLKNISLHGEAASADHVAAKEYVSTTFKEIINEGGYRPEQVFNMDETGLFWKKMPKRTFLMKDEERASGFKAAKDRITLVMCGNAAGHMIKPGLIYKSKNPRALKGKVKQNLPVYWMHNSKAWITKMLTSDWFHDCFIPEVKEYLREKDLPFNVLLIMDNAGGHAFDLEFEGVRIEFLPPNTTSLIQPMDQGVIRAFKAIYQRNSLENLVHAMDTTEDFSLKMYWRDFNIASCLNLIKKTIDEMKLNTVNASWKNLWEEEANTYKGFTPEEITHAAVAKAVQLARCLGGEGFADMTHAEVDELINEHSNPLTDEDLLELTKSASEEEEEEEEEASPRVEQGLTLDRLAGFMRLIKSAQDMAIEHDPDMRRALQVTAALDGAVQVYKSLLMRKKKERQQLPISMFITRTKRVIASSPSTPSVPSPSTTRTPATPSSASVPSPVSSHDDEEVLFESEKAPTTEEQ